MEHVDLGDEDDEGESFKNFMAEVTVIEPITMEKLQTRFQYWSSSDSKAMDSDKTCIICHKRNMNWPRYKKHLEIHDITQGRDSRSYMSLEDTIYVRDLWLTEEKPSPNPRYYDSVNEQEISEFESESDEVSSCLLYTSPSPRDRQKSRMPSSA